MKIYSQIPHVRLNLRVCELETDKSLRVEDSVPRVHCDPVLCSISDEMLDLGERNMGVLCAVTLFVGDSFYSVVSPDTDAAVGKGKESSQT